MTKAKRFLHQGVEVDEHFYSSQKLVQILEPLLTQARKQKIAKILSARCLDLQIVLDGIYDRGNALAVFRTAEAFGLQSVHVVDSQVSQRLAGRSSSGAESWLSVQHYVEAKSCIQNLRKQGFKIVTTGFENSTALESLCPEGPMALVLGNEHSGVSNEFKEASDLCVHIPMLGMTKSLNVSVAAGVCLHYLRPLYSKSKLNEEDKDYLKALFYSRSIKDVGRYLSASRNR